MSCNFVVNLCEFVVFGKRISAPACFPVFIPDSFNSCFRLLNIDTVAVDVGDVMLI